MTNVAPSYHYRVAVIDDDPDFLALIEHAYQGTDVCIERFLSLSEMGSFARMGDYDLIIVDYYLGQLTGFEIAEYVNVFFAHLPVIVLSGSEIELPKDRAWPPCVKAVLNKQAGLGALMAQVTKFVDSAACALPVQASSSSQLVPRQANLPVAAMSGSNARLVEV